MSKVSAGQALGPEFKTKTHGQLNAAGYVLHPSALPCRVGGPELRSQQGGYLGNKRKSLFQTRGEGVEGPTAAPATRISSPSNKASLCSPEFSLK